MENNNQVKQSISNKDKRILLPLLFLPCLLITRVLDNDTWFLLNSGRYVMNSGIPHIEPFSIHENMVFVMQQWLTDVVFWIIYNKFGENGLFLIVMICYVAIIFFMYKLTMKISNENFFVSFVITLFTSILVYTYMVTRPTIFTLVIVLIELNALENYALSRKYKYLLILPLLSLLLINLHAALWPILFILVLPYLIDSFNFKIGFIKSEGYKKRYLFITVAAMFLVAFVNPYGIDSMTYLIKSIGYTEMNNIMELKPPYINSIAGGLIYSCIIFISFAYIFYRRGKTKIRYFLLTLGTIYMVLTSVRNITYFAFCSLFPLAYYLEDFKIKNYSFSIKKNKLLRIILIALIIIIVIVSVYKMGINKNTYTEYLDLNNTIDYIFDNEDTTNIILYTGFNDGSLVQFRGLPSYIDPRAEVYFKKHNKNDDIFNEYFYLQKGRFHYKEILNKYKFTHLIVTKSDLLDTYLPTDGDYKKIYSNDRYNLFKRIN